MLNRNSYLKFFVLCLFIIGSLLESVSGTEEPLQKRQTITSKECPWASSLNFKFGDIIALDDKGKLNSDRLSEWHLSQASTLADIYNNYQYTGRNVAKALISIVYNPLKNPKEFKIRHFPLNQIFINGWSVQDSDIINDVKKLKHKLHFKKEDRPKFIDPHSFLSLFEIVEKDPQYIQFLLTNDLLPMGKKDFEDAKGLLKETDRYKYEKNEKRLPPHISNLRTKYTHAEKLILIYIHKNIKMIIENMLEGLEKPNINYVVINIASYRDMCQNCQKMREETTPLGKLLGEIQDYIRDKVNKSEIPIKVICSGVSHLQKQHRPNQPDSYSPIDIKNDRILYMSQNPLYTYALDRNTNSKQYLTLMNNYLCYKGIS